MFRWCTVLEIWCVTGIITFHFGPFFTLLPPNNPKNQNFEKMKKVLGYIIILHISTKNYDQTMRDSWNMVRDIRNCSFSFWASLYPFTLPSSLKNQIFEKRKNKFGHLIMLEMCTKKLWSDDVRFLRYGAWRV